jgi:NNP family nitrate/nitrite transporter-like MFS transporter
VPRTTPAPGAGAVAWWYHAAQLIRRRSAYWLSFLYAVTFGGFVGLCSVLPLLLHDVYRADAMEAGAVAALCGLLGSMIRPVGGYVADRQGGLRMLYYPKNGSPCVRLPQFLRSARPKGLLLCA